MPQENVPESEKKLKPKKKQDDSLKENEIPSNRVEKWVVI